MKDDPTIAAIREARHKISASVNHDPRKLVAHYLELQQRHRERLVSRQTVVIVIVPICFASAEFEHGPMSESTLVTNILHDGVAA
jgi:hypothetical protein